MSAQGRGGTCALRLGEVPGDKLPETGRQVGRLAVLGRVPHTQAPLLAWPQDAAPQRLWGKREGLRGAWDPGLPAWVGRGKVLLFKV